MGLPIFLSWSGGLSQEVATALHRWLPTVLQAADPFLSAEDIEKGARWSEQIASSLESSGFGILVLTNENLEAPWVLFEAGALSKMVGRAHVAPLLVDVQVSKIRPPLNQFQATKFDKKDILKLLETINQNSENPIKNEILDTTFNALWPALEGDVKTIMENYKRLSLVETQKPEVTLETIGLSIGDLIKSVQIIHTSVRMGRSNVIASGAIREMKKIVDVLEENVDADGDFFVIGEDAKFIREGTNRLLSYMKSRGSPAMAIEELGIDGAAE